MKLPVIHVIFTFKPDCLCEAEKEAKLHVYELLESGNPVCSECGEEWVLLSTCEAIGV